MTLSAPAQVSTRVEDPRSVDAAIESRFSARAFLPTPVPRDVIEDILRVASRAPSGTNTQPWKVYVLRGEKRQAICDAVCAAHDAVRADPALARLLLAASANGLYGVRRDGQISFIMDNCTGCTACETNCCACCFCATVHETNSFT